MESYRSYFDRQTVSPEFHEKLLALASQMPASASRPTGQRRRPWRTWAALATCCALVLGLGLSMATAPASTPSGTGSSAASSGGHSAPSPDTSAGGNQGTADFHGFLVEGPEAGDTSAFYALPAINYQNVDGQTAVDGSLSRYLLEGSFSVDLTKAEVQKIFWGPEGKPEGADGDLPWALFWGDYALSGSALYSGQGELLWVTLTGTNTEQGLSFTLILRPGELPLQCGLYSGLVSTDVNGTPVTGWSRTDDLDGDGVGDALCTSEFMAGDVGVRFEVRCTAGEDPADAADLCNTLLVRQALSDDGGMYLDHLLTNMDIPAWREAEFSSLQAARQETAFAPYLPTEDIPGYGEFSSHLSYQEGVRNQLSVHWYRGYDTVSITVSLPEGEAQYHLTAPDRPEEYDLRLYPIPWCDSVPEEYRETVDLPTFRAEDMSLAVVEARGHEKDTGGLTFSFGVLQDSGVLVEYRCDGLTAEQVWALVQGTSPSLSQT